MDGDRTHRALLRIDSALARLEAVAIEPRVDTQLADRHERLRDAVIETIARIDTLIAGRPE